MKLETHPAPRHHCRWTPPQRWQVYPQCLPPGQDPRPGSAEVLPHVPPPPRTGWMTKRERKEPTKWIKITYSGVRRQRGTKTAYYKKQYECFYDFVCVCVCVCVCVLTALWVNHHMPPHPHTHTASVLHRIIIQSLAVTGWMCVCVSVCTDGN